MAAQHAMSHANAIDRLASLVAWPDDPRAATILATWFCTANRSDFNTCGK